MAVSVRSYLTAGVAALAASAVVIAPVPNPVRSAISAEVVRLSAVVEPLLQPTNAAAAVLGLVDAPAPAKPATASSTATPRAAATANATGDWVVSAWNFANYWISYGVNLASWALGWFWPLSIIGNQAPVLWYNFGQPVAESAVFGLIVPVLNDPLNWAVWSAGFSIIAQTTLTAVVNTAIAEFNTIVGPFIPPLPPLPFPPLPIAAVPAALAATPVGGRVAAQAAETAVAPSDTAASGTGHTRRPGVVANVETAVAAAADAVDNTAKTVTAPLQSVTTDQGTGSGSHSNTPKAASTVSGATDAGASTAKSGQDNGKKAHSTGGSAREHKARAGS